MSPTDKVAELIDRYERGPSYYCKSCDDVFDAYEAEEGCPSCGYGKVRTDDYDFHEKIVKELAQALREERDRRTRAETITSGCHLREVRSWMQWTFRNGSTVKWGSDTPLVGEVTPWMLERLAERIKAAVDGEREERERTVKRLRDENLRLSIKLSMHEGDKT